MTGHQDPGRNEPCQCGSGVKFKKCHGRTPGTIRTELHGDDAAERILSRLKGHDAAEVLAATTLVFYGPSLRYSESVDVDASSFRLTFDHGEPRLDSAAIVLKTNTSRATEALVHELLHLDLPIRGFPCGDAMEVPATLDVAATSQLSALVGKLSNVVQHEINLDQFISMGFDRSAFLGPSARFPDYEAAASFGTALPGVASALVHAWWCLEYLRHWISVRHGAAEELGSIASRIGTWGSTVFADFSITTSQLRMWTESGRFKDVACHAQEFNTLLGLFRLPRFASWLEVRSQAGLSPRAVRLDAVGR
jgi:hypothetical protein